MKVKDIMTKDVQACGPDTNLAEVAKMMWELDCGVLPVVNGEGKVIGMITDRDICIAATKHRLASEIVAWESISGKLYACKPDDDITSALKTMGAERVRRLPVINDNGTLQGVLSVNDLILHARTAPVGKISAVSYDEVMNALKEICRHGVRVAA